MWPTMTLNFTLNDPDEKKMSKEEIKARMQEICHSGGWMQLKRDIIRYNQMREAVIKEMENHKDPVFNRFLNIYKSTMTVREFEHNRLKIYAICNRHAMFSCLPVDVLMNMGANKQRRQV